MKVVDIINLRPHLEKFAEKEMNIDSAIMLARPLRQVVSICNTFEQSRLALVKKFGEVKEDGSVEVISPAEKVLFQQAIEELIDEEVRIDRIPVIYLSSINTTPLEVINILPIFS